MRLIKAALVMLIQAQPGEREVRRAKRGWMMEDDGNAGTDDDEDKTVLRYQRSRYIVISSLQLVSGYRGFSVKNI